MPQYALVHYLTNVMVLRGCSPCGWGRGERFIWLGFIVSSAIVKMFGDTIGLGT